MPFNTAVGLGFHFLILKRTIESTSILSVYVFLDTRQDYLLSILDFDFYFFVFVLPL